MRWPAISNLNRATKSIVVAAILTLMFVTAARAQEQTFLRKIEVLGLQKLSSDQVVQLTGLQLGQSIDSRRIDAAADKLMQSGLFRHVSYRVRTEGYDMTLILELEEKPAVSGTAQSDVLGDVKWDGNRALTNQELARAFGLQAGTVVTKDKIYQAADAVRKAYAHRGYVDAVVAQTSRRNVLTRRVDYQFTITEGRQYRMGIFNVTGLSAADARQLKSQWTLAPDSVYDEPYLDQYRQSVIRPFLVTLAQRTGRRAKYEVTTNPDAQKLTIDVIVTFR